MPQPTPDTRIPAYPDTQTTVRPRLATRETGKRSDPDYGQVKAYVLRSTKKAAMKKVLEDPRYEDFSALIEELLQRYVYSLLD